MKALKKLILVMAAAFGLLALNSCDTNTATAYLLTGNGVSGSNSMEYEGEVVYIETTKMNKMTRYDIVEWLFVPDSVIVSFYEVNGKYYFSEPYEWETIGKEKYLIDVQGLGKKEITIKFDNEDPSWPEMYDLKLTKLK